MSTEQTMRWLRLNLALGVAGVAAASSVIGFLISATLRYAEEGNRLDTLDRGIATQHEAMVSVDGRLNDSTVGLAALDKRVSLLEAQFKWEKETKPVVPPGQGRQGR